MPFNFLLNNNYNMLQSQESCLKRVVINNPKIYLLMLQSQESRLKKKTSEITCNFNFEILKMIFPFSFRLLQDPEYNFYL